MNYKEIKELIELMTDTGVAELEVERSGNRIRIRREEEQPCRPEQQAAAPVPPPPATAAVAAVAAPVSEEKNVFKAPLVGTFYRSAAPDAKPFVEVGDSVTKGSVICIIEAMKLMNEIEAESDGVIRAVLAEDGKPVEYGEPLFELETGA